MVASIPLSEIHYSGPLIVTIRTFSEERYSFHLDFSHHPDVTLFDYVGQACANLFTDIDKKPSIRTCPDDWCLLKFSPAEQALEVVQVGGYDVSTTEYSTEEIWEMLEADG